MKASGKIAFLILSLIYLTPDFYRVINSIPFTGYSSGYSFQKASEDPKPKAKNATFQRRRFIPPTKTSEIVKIYSVIVQNSFYKPLFTDYTPLIPHITITFKSILLDFSYNKSPPIISC